MNNNKPSKKLVESIQQVVNETMSVSSTTASKVAHMGDGISLVDTPPPTKVGQIPVGKGKRVGLGWVSTPKDFKAITDIIKDAGIKIEGDPDDPRDVLKALNQAKHENQKKLADDLASKLSTSIGRPEDAISDVKQAIIQYDKAKAEFSKHTEKIADKIHRINKGVIEKRWKNTDKQDGQASKYVAWDIEETGEEHETQGALARPFDPKDNPFPWWNPFRYYPMNPYSPISPINVSPLNPWSPLSPVQLNPLFRPLRPGGPVQRKWDEWKKKKPKKPNKHIPGPTPIVPIAPGGTTPETPREKEERERQPYGPMAGQGEQETQGAQGPGPGSGSDGTIRPTTNRLSDSDPKAAQGQQTPKERIIANIIQKQQTKKLKKQGVPTTNSDPKAAQDSETAEAWWDPFDLYQYSPLNPDNVNPDWLQPIWNEKHPANPLIPTKLIPTLWKYSPSNPKSPTYIPRFLPTPDDGDEQEEPVDEPTIPEVDPDVLPYEELPVKKQHNGPYIPYEVTPYGEYESQAAQGPGQGSGSGGTIRPSARRIANVKRMLKKKKKSSRTT